MDLRQLRYFLAIVQAGSITRAAHVLGVAQPALSLHLRHLEEDLGSRLLIRSHAGVTPTEAGALLARRAGAVIDDLARIRDEVRSLEGDPAGVVRIGLPGTISGLIALPLIESSRARFPRIHLNIAEAMSGFIADWLAEGRVDLAVLYDAPQADGMVSELLLEEELVVLWRPKADCLPEMSLSALRGVPLVLPSAAHGLRRLIDRAMADLGIVPTIAVEIDSYANIKRLVAAGYGASILPLHAVLDEARQGRLVVSRIAAPGLWRGAHLVWSSGRPVLRAQAVIRDLLRCEILAQLDGGNWAAARRLQGR